MCSKLADRILIRRIVLDDRKAIEIFGVIPTRCLRSSTVSCACT